MDRMPCFVTLWTVSTCLLGALLPLGLLIPEHNMLLLVFLTGVFSWLLSGRLVHE